MHLSHLERLITWFGPASHTISGYLSAGELLRVLLTALAAGLVVLGLLLVVHAVCGTSFPPPADAVLAVVLGTLGVESMRRLDHGRVLPPSVLPRR